MGGETRDELNSKAVKQSERGGAATLPPPLPVNGRDRVHLPFDGYVTQIIIPHR